MAEMGGRDRADNSRERAVRPPQQPRNYIHAGELKSRHTKRKWSMVLELVPPRVAAKKYAFQKKRIMLPLSSLGTESSFERTVRPIRNSKSFCTVPT